MGECVRLWDAPGVALKGVVADLTRGIQGLFNVAGLQQSFDVRGPDASQTIRLKLQPHGQRIGLCLVRRSARAVNLTQDAQFVLHMVCNFVRDHIGRSKIAASAKALLECREELRVEVRFLVGGAVERSGRTRRATAGAGRLTREENQRRRAILFAHLRGKDLSPDIFGRGQNRRGEIGSLLFSRCQFARCRALRLRAVQQRCHIDAGKITDCENQQYATYA